ncbi:hypothetical protein C4577_01610 [Candidatus Parcubacteria bacterium]|nr:MAG: hypothetical protein C4577_01610 [Candidatus Parcubacteria bacterium]
MKFIVVGIGGVGMAHVCAIKRMGFEVLALVDLDEGILEKAKSKWINIWETFKEEVPVQKNCIYQTSLSGLPITPNDIIIIATPPTTHFSLMKEALRTKAGKILVEKPISTEMLCMSNPRLFVSAEWIYHSKLKSIDKISSLRMCYPKIPNGWDIPLELDFCPHFFSILISKGYDLKYISKAKAEFGFRYFCSHRAGSTKLSKVTFSGSRFGENGLFVNGRKLNWEEDLFDKQLISLQQGKMVSFDEMLYWENELKAEL